MLPVTFRRSAIIACVALAACAPRRAAVPVPSPVPFARPAAPVNPLLPAMPLVTGPLDIRVVYPRAGELVASRDSAFIFGSAGNGDAFVSVNGAPAPVWPNGAFMAFVPVPAVEHPVYEIVAIAGADTARLSHTVRIQQPLTVEAVAPTTSESTADTLTARVPPGPAVPAAPRYGVLGGAPSMASDTDRVITGRPIPDPNYTRFFLLPGTVVRVVSQGGANTRIALDDGQELLVPTNEVALGVDSLVAPVRSTGAVRVEPATDWIDVVIPTGSPPPYFVEEDTAAIKVTLYGTPSAVATDTSGAVTHASSGDQLLADVAQSHTGTRSMYTIGLRRNVYGYLAFWRDSAFVLRVRRHPRVNAASPVQGLTIVVDPGHPGLPGESPGATGPTGLREPDAVLAVGLRLRDYLQARGVNVILTRTTPDPVALNVRPIVARRANAHALVSIHLNAVPDNVNPLNHHGTTTYYWQPHSRRLGELTQQAMIRNMFLRDIGTLRENFALVRGPWMPSILTEGAFIILPDQEFALRTPEYQDAYARSILEGLEQYFAEVASGR